MKLVMVLLSLLFPFVANSNGEEGKSADVKPLVITLQNHQFTPSEIHIPARQAAVIIVKNMDATAEEFESAALSIEKVIAGHGQGEIHIRPSEHGHYTFVGEYHEKIARGVIVVD